MGKRLYPFAEEHLRAIADLLADTHEGLTGTEIGQLLRQCGIDDPLEGATKRHRLFEALASCQRRDRASNGVVRFLVTAMAPVRYVRASDLFEERRAALNEVLSFAGLYLHEDGRMRRRSPARTLDEAVNRAKRLTDEMLRRGVHSQVVRFCHVDLLQEDCFDAVFEATKGLAERIREMTGLVEDGADLVEKVFALGSSGLPHLAFNSLRSLSEKSEQTGLLNLMKGIFGTFRNPAAHSPKIKWHVSEQDALDLLTILSLVHRRLDSAVPTAAAAQAVP